MSLFIHDYITIERLGRPSVPSDNRMDQDQLLHDPPNILVAECREPRTYNGLLAVWRRKKQLWTNTQRDLHAGEISFHVAIRLYGWLPGGSKPAADPEVNSAVCGSTTTARPAADSRILSPSIGIKIGELRKDEIGRRASS